MAAPAFSIPKQNAALLADPALREALVKYARRRLPPGEVEDLVQNTLADALVSAHAPSDPNDFQRWIHGIARHKIADGYRRRGRLPALDTETHIQVSDPGPRARELAQWVERELPKTEHAQATLHWLLREGDGESLDEIARDAALPATRVRQRVSRLRRHFYSRWVALGAAGLALLLAAGLWLSHAQHVSTVAPSIAKELVTPPPTPSAEQFAPAASAPAVTPRSDEPRSTPSPKLRPKIRSRTPAPKLEPKLQPSEPIEQLKSSASTPDQRALSVRKNRKNAPASKAAPVSSERL